MCNYGNRSFPLSWIFFEYWFNLFVVLKLYLPYLLLTNIDITLFPSLFLIGLGRNTVSTVLLKKPYLSVPSWEALLLKESACYSLQNSLLATTPIKQCPFFLYIYPPAVLNSNVLSWLGHQIQYISLYHKFIFIPNSLWLLNAQIALLTGNYRCSNWLF